MNINLFFPPKTFSGEKGVVLALLPAQAPHASMTMTLTGDGYALQMDVFAQDLAIIRDFFAKYFQSDKPGRVNHNVAPVKLNGSDGYRFNLYRDNMGEPYRDGFTIEISFGQKYYSDFFSADAVRELSQALNATPLLVFNTKHPKNGLDVAVHYDENGDIFQATYMDGEEVDLTNRVKLQFESELRLFTQA